MEYPRDTEQIAPRSPMIWEQQGITKEEWLAWPTPEQFEEYLKGIGEASDIFPEHGEGVPALYSAPGTSTAGFNEIALTIHHHEEPPRSQPAQYQIADLGGIDPKHLTGGMLPGEIIPGAIGPGIGYEPPPSPLPFPDPRPEIYIGKAPEAIPGDSNGFSLLMAALILL